MWILYQEEMILFFNYLKVNSILCGFKTFCMTYDFNTQIPDEIIKYLICFIEML